MEEIPDQSTQPNKVAVPQIRGEDSAQTLRKVLVLAYYFPPLGMGGTQRTTKFVKYLPDFGWEPIVVTVKDIAYFATDSSFLEEVAKARVIRTGSLDPQRLASIFFFGKKNQSASSNFPKSRLRRTLNRCFAFFLVPDSKILWIPFVMVRALAVIKREKIDCLLSTSPPHSVHLAGIILKRLTKIPVVVDFRDGWSGGNFQTEPTGLHKWMNKRLQKWALGNADSIVAVSDGLRENLRTQGDRASSFHTITNGYDGADLSQALNLLGHDAKKFTITFTGSVSPIAPMDAFLLALSELVKSEPQLRAEIRVEFVGIDLKGSLQAHVHDLELEDLVILSGYLDHRQALSKILNADLLLYPVAKWATPDFVPGKTFEYLASGVPILAIGPSVEGIRIMQACTQVEHVDHDDVTGIQKVMSRYLQLYRAGVRVKKLNGQPKYERRTLTGELAKVLTEVS